MSAPARRVVRELRVRQIGRQQCQTDIGELVRGYGPGANDVGHLGWPVERC